MVEILKANETDAKVILELQRLAFQSEAMLYNDFTIPPLTQTLEELEKQFQNHIFLKAVGSNIIVGSVRAYKENETCYIGRLIVHPTYQNKGIGRKLMNEIEDYFRGVNRFKLATGSKSVKNISLYTKLGYRIFKSEKVNDALELVYLEKIKPVL